VGLTIKTGWLRRITSERFQRLGREFFWISLGQAAAVLGGLVGVRILTELLEPAAFGQLALGMTVATLVHQVVLGPLGNGATRFYAPAREAGALHAYLAAVCDMVLTSTGGIILVALLSGVGLILAGLSRWMGLGVADLCFALLSGYNSILSGTQNAARQRIIVAFHQGLASWGRFLVAAGLILWLGATSTVAMMGYNLAMIFVLASQYFFFRRIINSAGGADTAEMIVNNQWRTQMFTYSWPFATWGIFTWAQIASDRWALQMFATTQDVGLYAVLYQLGYYPITILTGLMVQLVSPVFFQRAGDASDSSRMQQVHTLNWRLTIGALILTGAATLVAFGLHGLVFRWLVAPDYRAVSWMLPGMVLAGGFFATGQFAVISLLSGTETRSLIAPKIATALIGVLLNMLGAAWWGIIGVVSASAVTAAVYLLWTLYLVRTRHNQNSTEGVR